MKRKYTKAKVEIISMKTEAGICKDSDYNGATGTDPQKDPNDSTTNYNDPFGAKEFNGIGNDDFSSDGNGVNDFPFDPTPSTKE